MRLSRFRFSTGLIVVALTSACAANNASSPDAGRRDAGMTMPPDSGPPRVDAGRDGGTTMRDSGAPLPERCSSEHMRFMDEFGREAYCVYVAETGNDANEGTPDAPFRTLARALEVAVARGVATGRVHAVAVSRGTYRERLVLVNGVSIYGGYDASDGWSRADGNETIVVSAVPQQGRIEGLVAESISAPTVVERLTIRAGSTLLAEPDVDVYGVRVASSTPALPELGGLILRELDVVAGDASRGSDGAMGGDGDDGEQGDIGEAGGTSDGNPNRGGAGAVSICGVMTVEATRGGEGGVGGGDGAMGCGTFEASATAGRPPPALLTCIGGTVGDACGCFDGGAAGGPGNVCAMTPARDGDAAVASPVRGTVRDGRWVGRPGDDGQSGAHGIGGSGGGGGGSGCNAAGWGPTGGGGGGGGSGGCGGLGGTGGRSGGSSFGLFAVDSTFAVPGSTFRSGAGGDGGAGARGGLGGAGGRGGDGAPGGFAGGRGGAGQDGGDGGAGAAGPGGSSVAAMVCRSEVADLDLPPLTAGEAGIGGMAAPMGAAGLDGIAAPIFFGCQL
jgi:hypothetical protein